MPNLVQNCNTFVRFEKNEDGDKVKRRYRRGDEVKFTTAEAEKLLALEVGGRHLWVKTEADIEKEEQNVARSDVDPTSTTAAVKESSLTTQTVVKPEGKTAGSANAPTSNK